MMSLKNIVSHKNHSSCQFVCSASLYISFIGLMVAMSFHSVFEGIIIGTADTWQSVATMWKAEKDSVFGSVQALICQR